MQRLITPLASFGLITIISCIVAFGVQQSTSTDRAKDLFVGKWKLNIEKSTLPPAGETVTIERQAEGYKISIDLAHDNGTHLKSWSVTDMKGTVSKVTQADGTPMNEEWRVTREGSDSFVVESSPFRSVVRYAVGAEGQTLTKKEISSDIIGAK